MIRDQNYSQHIWSDEKYYFYFPKNTRSAKNLPWDLFVFVFVFFCMQHFQAWTRLISVIWVRVPIVKLPFLYHCFHHITLLLVPSVQDYAYRIQKCQVKWGHYFIWLNIYKLHDLYYFMKKRTINHLIIISKSFKVKTKKTQDIHGWLMWWVPTFSAEDSHSIPASKKKNPLEKRMATHSSILARRILWIEETAYSPGITTFSWLSNATIFLS